LSVQFLRGPRDHGLGIDAKVFNLYENVMNLSLDLNASATFEETEMLSFRMEIVTLVKANPS